MRLLSTFAFLCFFLSSNDARPDSISSDFSIGKTYENEVQVSKVKIPLPPGQWILTALNEERNNVSDVTASLTFTNITSSRLNSYIVVSTNVDMARYNGWQSHRFCSRKDIYFIQVDADYPNEQACWGLNHVIMSSTSTYTPKYGLNIQNTLRQRGIEMPRTLITTIFRVANSHKFITYEILQNPELAGFPPSQDINWNSSLWHKDMINSDKDRLSYMENTRNSNSSIYGYLRKQF